MTSPSENAYVWAWLPDATSPVVAGRISRHGNGYRFAYGESYLSRPEAISLYAPELPLRPGWIDAPEGLDMAGCLRDASPDSWGQRVIIARLTGLLGAAADQITLDKLTFLLESGSNRIGALDFQRSPTEYVPRSHTATLDELHAAADALQAGELREELATALVDGTAVGGRRLAQHRHVRRVPVRERLPHEPTQTRRRHQWAMSRDFRYPMAVGREFPATVSRKV